MRPISRIADLGECELISLFRRLNPRQRSALARFAIRHTNGVPFAIALRQLRSDLARCGGRRV